MPPTFRSRGRLATVLALTAVASTTAVAGPTAPVAQPAANAAASRTAPLGRPNVLLVTIDDAAPGDLRYMPHTRALVADRGVTMTNFVAPTPICVPSRASLLTGDYAHNHGAVTVGGDRGTAEYFASSGQNRDTLPVWLNRAGYDTFVTGKWMNGYERRLPAKAAEPGWDRWEPATLGTYDFFSTRFFERGRLTGRPGVHSTYQITDRAAGYITSKKADPDPWFAWVNYVAPHHGAPHTPDDPEGVGTTVPAPQDRNDFRHLRLPRKPNMWHADEGTFGSEPTRRPTPRVKAAGREAFQQRVEALQSVDRGVRRQVRALSRTGQLANTYVIVTSDNGFMVGEHNFIGKLYPYRESVTVPMAIRGPGIPQGRVVRTAAAVPDLAVTIAGLGGATPPSSSVDGADFLPVLTDPRTLARPIPIEGYRMHTETGVRLYYGVIDGSWTYVHKRNGDEELYDATTDAYQVRNLADAPGHVSDLVRLRKLARELRDCRADSCPKVYVAAP